MTEQGQDKVYVPPETEDSPFLSDLQRAHGIQPQSNNGFAQIVHLIEAGCLQKGNGVRTIEFTPDAVEKFAELYLSDPEPRHEVLLDIDPPSEPVAQEPCQAGNCTNRSRHKCRICGRRLCRRHAAIDSDRGVQYASCLGDCGSDSAIVPSDALLDPVANPPVPDPVFQECDEDGCDSTAHGFCMMCGKTLCRDHTAYGATNLCRPCSGT